MKWESESRLLTIEDNKLTLKDKKGTYAPFAHYCTDIQEINIFLPEDENDLGFILFKSQFEHKDLSDFSKAHSYRNCYIETASTLIPKLEELRSYTKETLSIKKTYKKEDIKVEEKKSNKNLIFIAIAVLAIAAIALLKK